MTRPRMILPLLLASLIAPSLASAQTGLDEAGEQAMLARINAMRASQRLEPLVRHPRLDAAARAHSSDMAVQQQLTHVSDSSGTPADRVTAAGVNAASVSENVALHRSSAEAHEALIGSDAHRANMMSADATHVGLAALRTEQGVYVTQLFASIRPEAPAPVAATPPPPSTPDVAPRIPAPSTERVEEPAAGSAVVAPIAPVAPVAPARATRPNLPPANLQVQPGTHGTVVIARRGGRIVAYWVYGSGRWWYYPYPPNARPGQQLQVDRSVQGPPPGFPAHPGAVAPPPQPRMAPPPPRGTSLVIQPYGARMQVAPNTAFYAVPPPPLVGPPTRAWRRSVRRWERARRRWQRRQARMRRRAL